MSLHQLIRELSDKNVHLALGNEDELKVSGGQQHLSNDLLSTIRAHKPELLQWLRNISSPQQPIKKQVPQPDVLPLSFAQQRLWVLDKLQGSSAEYNIPFAFSFTGTLQITRLNEVFSIIVQRHAILRTVYEFSSGEACQRVIPAEDCRFQVQVENCFAEEHVDSLMLLQQRLKAAAAKPFDLSCDLMLRVLVLQQSPTKATVLITMHHIAADGWSVANLLKEFLALYQVEQDCRATLLPPLELQYSDYACWQREQGISAETRTYWQQQLAGAPETHGLPLARPRAQVKAYQGAVISGQVTPVACQQLLQLAATHQLTPFMLLHGIFALLVSRHSYADDIVIGTPVANRMQPELNDLIGFFINTLVLRLDTAQASLTDYFAHLRQVHRDAQTHQQMPFELLVEQSGQGRSSAVTPLFQILLTFNSDFGVTVAERDRQFSLPDCSLAVIPSGFYQAKYDLTVEFELDDSGLKVHWLYDVALFDVEQITQLNQHFCQLVQSFAAIGADNPRLTSLSMLDAAETTQLLYGWNQTAVRYPNEELVHQLFEQQVLRQPTHPAVCFAEHQLTYQQLNERANQLANYLITVMPQAPDMLIGIYAHRSIEMVVAILAVLKAGAAYVPLDPQSPVDRLVDVLQDSGITLVLTQQLLAPQLAGYAGTQLILDDSFATFRQMPTSNPALLVQPAQLAYVIYTSGSTGKPKGVMVEHQALLNRILWMQQQYGATPADRVLQKTPFTFDVSVWEFIWTLSHGATLIIAAPDGHKDPVYLTELIQREGVTKLHFVPSMLGLMLEHGGLARCDSLQQVFCSGEALLKSQVEAFRQQLPAVSLHNLYGPTEAAIDVSYWDCSNDVSAGVPIGEPIANIQLLILDQQFGLVPDGAVGELCIGGIGLARGYLNRPDLTADRFIANPYFQAGKASCSERLYRTGDLVSRRKGGWIDYHGRTDFQLKIRGFRIEAGEVEFQLQQLPGVESAVVVARSLSGSQQLVAYVKADSDQQCRVDELRLALSHRLPDYMVPSLIIQLTDWPLTVNGKLDRKALPLPELDVSVEFLAAQTETERQLIEIAANLLQRTAADISVTADFFSLGGYSLLAVKFLLQVEAVSGIRLSMHELFNMGSFQALAAKCDVALQAAVLKQQLALVDSDELDEVVF